MKNAKNGSAATFVMVPIPLEVLEESDIDIGDLVQFAAGDGVVVMEAVTDLGDIVCNGDCKNCPVDRIDCNNDCESCPCCGCEESEVK